MPNKCCIYGCSSNNKSKVKDNVYVIMHKFLFKPEDLEFWIKKLPNENFLFTNYKQICIWHWPEDTDVMRGKGGSYVSIDPPICL